MVAAMLAWVRQWLLLCTILQQVVFDRAPQVCRPIIPQGCAVYLRICILCVGTAYILPAHTAPERPQARLAMRLPADLKEPPRDQQYADAQSFPSRY